MLTFTKILIIVLALAVAAAAQTTGYSDTEPAKPHIRGEVPKTLDELKAQAKKTKADDHLIFLWDKFKDQTTLMTKPDNLVGSWEGAAPIIGSSGPYSAGTPRMIFVDIETYFPGKTLTDTPTKYAMVFYGMSPDWQWLKSDKLIYFLLDDKDRFSLEPVASDADVTGARKVEEKVAYVISRDDVYRIANAKKVELRIGTAPPRTLKPKILQKWKAIADLTQLEPVKET
jgi:hypothetical protein